ncbi:MAG: hypothetical protein IJV15_07870 [Lachnospiraceae bacterium]|nr:hypothetical protein [Lachnospiraceae bacterium]
MGDFVVNSKLYTPEICLIDEEELERDREYMMQMYPVRARMIMVLVEDECDRLEYEGSPMFAMFPDKETLRRIADKIYNKIKYKDDDNELRHLIEVMLCNEFYVRRSRYKRRRRFF